MSSYPRKTTELSGDYLRAQQDWDPMVDQHRAMYTALGTTSLDLDIYDFGGKHRLLPRDGGIPMAVNKIGIILYPSTTDAWDDTMVSIPIVFWAPNYNQWAMLYCGYDGTTQKEGLAFSNDLIHWTKYAGNPVFAGSETWNLGGVTGCYVWYENGTYYFFYSGSETTGIEVGTRQIGLATSTDLITWTEIAAPVIPVDGTSPAWQSNQAYKSEIVKVNDTYYHFFNGQGADTKEQVGYATASAITGPYTVAENAVLTYGAPAAWDGQSIADPCLLLMGDTWVMYYAGANVGITEFSNGVATTSTTNFPTGWTKATGNPYQKPSPGGADSYMSAKPYIVLSGGKVYQFFTAQYDASHAYCSLAMLENPPLLHISNGDVTVVTTTASATTNGIILDCGAMSVNAPNWGNWRVMATIQYTLSSGDATIAVTAGTASNTPESCTGGWQVMQTDFFSCSSDDDSAYLAVALTVAAPAGTITIAAVTYTFIQG